MAYVGSHPFAFCWRKDGIEACRLPSRNCCHGNLAAGGPTYLSPLFSEPATKTQRWLCVAALTWGKGDAMGFCIGARLQPLRLSNAVYSQPRSGVDPLVQPGASRWWRPRSTLQAA